MILVVFSLGMREIKIVIFDMEGMVGVKFFMGELKGYNEISDNVWEDVDFVVELWCVEYLVLLGYWIDFGEGNFDILDLSEIFILGYLMGEIVEEIKMGYVYVNFNFDGIFIVFEFVFYEKIGDCFYRIMIWYLNFGGS